MSAFEKSPSNDSKTEKVQIGIQSSFQTFTDEQDREFSLPLTAADSPQIGSNNKALNRDTSIN